MNELVRKIQKLKPAGKAGLTLGILVALGLALLLNARVRGLSFWRTAFYLPQITPAVAAGVLWLRILSPQNGLLN